MKQMTVQKIGCLFLLIAVLGVSSLIPFVYESQSIFYKFGTAKLFLRSGKILGIFCVVLVTVQFILIARIRWLDTVFGLDTLWRYHKRNGIIIVVLILLHGILVIGAEGFVLFPLEKRYWPEHLGIITALLFFGFIFGSYFRGRLKLAYHLWFTGHRLIAPVLGVMVFVHACNVSESFESGVPFGGLVAVYILLVLAGLIKWLKILPWFNHRFRIKRINAIAADTWQIQAALTDKKGFSYLPGQFAFVTPISDKLAREAHPFTLASSAKNSDDIEFVIRASGDFTQSLGGLTSGDGLLVDGPYGRFSHQLLQDDAPIIMIAGGIGITPFLSMLRTMADDGTHRPVMLIWSNKTEASLVCQEEMSQWESKLDNFYLHTIFTQEERPGSLFGRIDFDCLNQLLADMSRSSHCFVCGPHAFSNQTISCLKRLGFSPDKVYTESFML